MSDIYDVLENSAENMREREPEDNRENGRLSREEYSRMKKAEKEAIYEMIDNTLLDMAKGPQRLKEYLDIQSRMDRYSVANAILIMNQKPDAVQLKDFNGWKETGASVKRGEKGIKILEPVEFVTPDGKSGVSYNVKKVLDITQTTARKPVMVKTVSDERSLLKALINKAPVAIKPVDSIEGKDTAYYDHEMGMILVERNLQPEDFFRSIAKELSHAEIAKESESYKREDADFTAAGAAYMLCSKYGIDTKELGELTMPEELRSAEGKQIRAELSFAKEAFSQINERMADSFYKQRSEREKQQER